jgi:hypothetical protein
VVSADGADMHLVLHEIDACLSAEFDVEHSTIQVEHPSRPTEADAHP